MSRISDLLYNYAPKQVLVLLNYILALVGADIHYDVSSKKDISRNNGDQMTNLG